MTNQTIEKKIDAAHATAQQAYRSRDIRAYMDCFTPDLTYRQANGITIGRDQLSADVAAQFRQLGAAATIYQREALRASPIGVEEDLVQQAWTCATAFGILHRAWHIERHGTYTWSNASGQWRIVAVNIISERILNQSWHFGHTPQPPFGTDAS